jgi:ribonuclease VapC
MTGEADSRAYRAAIAFTPSPVISAVTLLETRIVLLARSGPGAIATLDELIDRAGIAVIPFDRPLAEAAFEAFKRYGKGQGHKAQLNIIDCAAYALAKSRNLPRLFKGGDFATTDNASALPSGG